MAKQESALSKEEVLELIGDPEQHVREMEVFSQSVQVFWDHHESLLKEHPDSWVAVHKDEILVAETSEALFKAMERAGIPRGQAFVRFVSPKKRILIL